MLLLLKDRYDGLHGLHALIVQKVQRAALLIVGMGQLHRMAEGIDFILTLPNPGGTGGLVLPKAGP